jgi:hypothetical protein
MPDDRRLTGDIGWFLHGFEPSAQLESKAPASAVAKANSGIDPRIGGHCGRSRRHALVRHRAAFLQQLAERTAVLRAQFDAIDVLKYKPTFEGAAARAKRFLDAFRTIGEGLMPARRK